MSYQKASSSWDINYIETPAIIRRVRHYKPKDISQAEFKATACEKHSGKPYKKVVITAGDHEDEPRNFEEYYKAQSVDFRCLKCAMEACKQLYEEKEKLQEKLETSEGNLKYMEAEAVELTHKNVEQQQQILATDMYLKDLVENARYIERNIENIRRNPAIQNAIKRPRWG